MTGRVLVVDDDHRWRLLVRLALAGTSFHVAGEASTLAEGCRLGASLQPDVVLVDLQLPGGAGPLDDLAAAAPAALLVAVTSFPGGDAHTPVQSTRAAVLARGLAPAAIAPALDRLVASQAADEVDATSMLRLPPEPASARAARRFAVEVLEGSECAGDVLDTVLLLLSEVVSNAIVHARTDLEVGVAVHGGVVRVEVLDGATGPIHRRASGPDDVGGRGTELVELLAESWGTDRLTTGKRVWFEVTCPGAGPS